MSRTLRRTVLVLVLLAAAGCGLMGRSDQDAQYQVAANLVISDLPVPDGYRIDNSHSFFNVNPTTGTRVVFVTYRGRGDALKLMEFFRQNMSISGWKLREESGDFGSYVLDFEKAKEAAEVRITPSRYSTELTISLNPKSAG